MRKQSMNAGIRDHNLMISNGTTSAPGIFYAGHASSAVVETIDYFVGYTQTFVGRVERY